MRFKKSPQLPGAGRTRAWHHHGSHTPISPGAILQVKWPVNPNILAASVGPETGSWPISTLNIPYGNACFERV